MHQRKLLFIDDDKFWLKTVKELFTHYAYRVLTADTPRSGIDFAKTFRPDCVLLDLNMPGMGGDAVAACLRADPDLAKIPIIVISGDETKELDAYREYKADGFLLKGPNYEKVRATIEGLLRRVDWDRGVIEKGNLRLCRDDNFSVFCDSQLIANLSASCFKFLSLLVDKSPEFVSEEEISVRVLNAEYADNSSGIIKVMAHRLRKKLGRQLGKRITSCKDKGWVYGSAFNNNSFSVTHM